jgi:predicted phage-related endonuclease
VNTAAAERQEIGEGLGASEIAAAAGLDPFRSPLQLWLEKTGQAPPFAGNEITDWGLEVEVPMVAWYGRRHVDEATEKMRRPANSIYREAPSWARCTPDAVVHAGDVMGPVLRVVQAKNVGFRMMHRWQDGPPDYVVCQCAWECFVVGIGRADVIASLGGGPPEVYTLWRDEQMVADLLAIGERFMRHVAERTEPRTTHHADWATYLANRAKSRGFIVPATAADESLVEEWRTSTLALKAAEKRSDLAKNRVRRYLADANADGMETAFGVATWRPNKNGDRALRAPRGWGAEEK